MGTAQQDSATQQPDSSKEWIFQGNVAVPNASEVNWDDVNDPVPDEVRKGFPEVGEQLKASFSENLPAEIECIVIIGDITQFSCDVHQNQKYLGVPARGYFATSRRVNQKEWEDSILWCSTELKHLTWTKISGGIRCSQRCWEQFNSARDAVNNPQNTADVLAMWGTRSYFDAEGSAWGFDGKLELPSRTAEHGAGDVLELAREAFHAAAGLPIEWPSGIAFLVVQCEILEMMSADDASAIRIPVREFLQGSCQSKSSEGETWLGLEPAARRIMRQRRVRERIN
jgi:hypothetical protein